MSIANLISVVFHIVKTYLFIVGSVNLGSFFYSFTLDSSHLENNLGKPKPPDLGKI